MNATLFCRSLDEVQLRIDSIDRQIVALIAERGVYVMEAARFMKMADHLDAPQRTERIIDSLRRLSVEEGADPDVVEATYRAMIAAFIRLELAADSTVLRAVESTRI
jgi:isochorismate pyruvate lyase